MFLDALCYNKSTYFFLNYLKLGKNEIIETSILIEFFVLILFFSHYWMLLNIKLVKERIGGDICHGDKISCILKYSFNTIILIMLKENKTFCIGATLGPLVCV